MLKPLKIMVLSIVIPAVMSFAGVGVDFGSQQGGATSPASGQTQYKSWGTSKMLLEQNNSITAHMPVTPPSTDSTYDPIHGWGGDNAAILGLQLYNGNGTRVIIDRLVANKVVHVLGQDVYNEYLNEEGPKDVIRIKHEEVGGDFFASDSAGRRPQDSRTPTPVPEPTTLAILGIAAAAWAIGSKRSSRKRLV